MKIVIQAVQPARGHGFARVGTGRKTYFADKRRSVRTTSKVRLRQRWSRESSS